LHAGQSLTYRELDRRAARLAYRLHRASVGPERVVGLQLRRGVDIVVAMLAVLKAGGAYLPLDPDYPAHPLRYMLADSGATVLVTNAGAQPPEVPQGIHVVDVVDVVDDADGPEHPGDAGVHPDQAAYVVYTSGSSGRPKGVVVTHSGLANMVAGLLR